MYISLAFMLRTAVGSSENINIIVIVAFLWEDQISDPMDHSVHAAYRGSNETTLDRDSFDAVYHGLVILDHIILFGSSQRNTHYY